MANRSFCTKCGARLTPGASFCTACGTPVPAEKPPAQAPAAAAAAPALVPAPAPSPAPTPSAAASPVARTSTFVASTAGAVGQAQGAFAAASAAASLPWTTVRGSAPIDTRELLSRALPALATTLPRPNLRIPALSILVTLAMDVGIALLRGGPIGWPLLATRLVTGLATSAFGLVAGGKAGMARKLTGIASVVFGVVQLVSLASGALAVARTPIQLLPLLPSLVAVVSGLVLSVSTAVGAWRK